MARPSREDAVQDRPDDESRNPADRDTLSQYDAEGVRLRLLFDYMLEGVAYCRMLFDEHGDPDDFVYLAVNPAFGSLTGLSDVVGKRVTEVIPGIKQTNPELFEAYGHVALTGEARQLEVEVEQLGIVLDVSVFRPEPGHFVAVFENITERKRIERELEELNRFLELRVEERTRDLEEAILLRHETFARKDERRALQEVLAAGGVWAGCALLDAALDIVWASSRFLQLLPADAPQRIVGHNVRDVSPFIEALGLPARLEHVFTTGEPFDLDTATLVEDGRVAEHWKRSAYRLPTGHVLLVVERFRVRVGDGVQQDPERESEDAHDA